MSDNNIEKPEESYEWAEGEEAEVAEPIDERDSGWVFGHTPPAEQKNWLQRMVGRWLKWLEHFTANHVHDGGDGDESVAKVDFDQHIKYGDYGELFQKADNKNLYSVEGHHTGDGEARIGADQIAANELTRHREDAPIIITDVDGKTDEGTIQVRYVRAPNATISFRNALGQNFAVVEANRFHATREVRANTVVADNLPNAYGRVLSNGDLNDDSYGIETVNHTDDTGVYDVILEEPGVVDGEGVMQLLEVQVTLWDSFDSPGMVTAFGFTDDDELHARVYTYSHNGEAEDRAFTVWVRT